MARRIEITISFTVMRHGKEVNKKVTGGLMFFRQK